MPTIAIFDSGVGGLSIYQEIKQKLPDYRYVFVSDNQAYPYGTKSEQELKTRVKCVVGRVIEQYAPDILVIACNTASTVVLPLLREAFDLPIVGVVPAIKPAAKLSKSRVIGLLATPATIQRAYTDQLIAEHAHDCEVIKVGSSRLVNLVEQTLHGSTIEISEIGHEIQPFMDIDGLDVLILACTHFPLINKEISSIFKENDKDICLLDSGAGIANRVVELVEGNRLLNNHLLKSVAVFTQEIDVEHYFRENLKKLGFTNIELLMIE